MSTTQTLWDRLPSLSPPGKRSNRGRPPLPPLEATPARLAQFETLLQAKGKMLRICFPESVLQVGIESGAWVAFGDWIEIV